MEEKLIATLVIFSTKIFSGSSVKLTDKIIGKISSDKSRETNVRRGHKVLLWTAGILYFVTVNSLNRGYDTMISIFLLWAYLTKFIFTTSSGTPVFSITQDGLVEHPLSAIADIVVNLAISLHTIWILMSL